MNNRRITQGKKLEAVLLNGELSLSRDEGKTCRYIYKHNSGEITTKSCVNPFELITELVLKYKLL